MFGTSGGTPGGDAGFGAQQGYQTRSRGRGRHEAPEERFVEGDLFGSTKRQSFRSTERPTGLPPRAAYYDGPGAVGGGGGGGIGAGGHSQTPRVQPSPFARGPGVQPSPFARAPTPTNTFFPTAPGSAYGGARYSQVSPATDPRQSNQRGFSPTVGFGSEVALVPVEAGGAGGGGQNVMDDGDDGDDDDDDMPTRSLADDPDVRGEGRRPADGLRYRRGGGGGGVGGGRGIVGGGFDADEPDTHRDTWVVVWGVPPGSANEVLTRFLQFGHVVEQRGQPGSNWLYLKYATRLQAEKALAAGHGSRLTATVMLGVQKVPDDETWQSLREGRIPPLSTGQPVLASAARGRVPNGDAMEVDDADLLDAPPQRPRGDKSVCGRIMALFGFY